MSQFELCPACEGRGSRVNPAIDGHGISPEEFAEDPEFLENYLGGMYDEPCPLCRGVRVIDRREELIRGLSECSDGGEPFSCDLCPNPAVKHWVTRHPEYPGGDCYWPTDHFRCLEHCSEEHRANLEKFGLLREAR